MPSQKDSRKYLNSLKFYLSNSPKIQRNSKRSFKISWINKTTNSIEHWRSRVQRENNHFICIYVLGIKEKSKINDLSFYFRKLEKRQRKFKLSKEREITKIRGGRINKMGRK